MPKNLGLYNDDLSTPRKKDVDNCYGPNNAPPYPVTSVNGQTGAVTLTKANVGLNNVDNVKQYSANNPPPYPVTSVNSKSGAVTLSKGDVGLGNVDNIKQYSASNPPPYPVASVNGKTGKVNLVASDVGAVSTDNITQTLGTSTTKVPSEKAVSDAIVAAGGGVDSVNGKTGDVVLNAADVGALPNTTVIPSKTSQLTNDSGFITDTEFADKVSKSGDTMTGKLTVPQVETGDGNSNFFQCRKFRGEGNADTYYHAIDFGYKNHDQVDFHEWGGRWNFYKNTSGKANTGMLCGSITANGWEGSAKLKSGSTMVTSQLTENSNVIATTAFVHGLVDEALASSSAGVSIIVQSSQPTGQKIGDFWYQTT